MITVNSGQRYEKKRKTNSEKQKKCYRTPFFLVFNGYSAAKCSLFPTRYKKSPTHITYGKCDVSGGLFLIILRYYSHEKAGNIHPYLMSFSI